MRVYEQCTTKKINKEKEKEKKTLQKAQFQMPTTERPIISASQKAKKRYGSGGCS